MVMQRLFLSPRKNDFFSLLALLLTLIFFIGVYLVSNYAVRSVLLCALIGYYIILTRSNVPSALIFVFMLTYSVPLVKYWFQNMPISAFSSGVDSVYWEHLTDVFFLGILMFGFALAITTQVRVKSEVVYTRKSRGIDYLFYFFISMALIFSIIFGIKGSNIFEHDGYNVGGLRKTSLHEYFVVFFICYMVWPTKKTNYLNFYFGILAVIWSAKTFIYGGRVEVILLLIAIQYFQNDFFRKGLTFKFLIFLLLMFATAVALERIRSEPLNFLSNPIGTLLPKDILEESSVQLGNAPDALFSGARLIMLREENYLSREDSAISGALNLFPQILPSAAYPKLASLGGYMQNIIPSPGGGLIFAYFFAWFGFSGVIILSFLLGLFLRYLYFYSSQMFLLPLSIYTFSSFPRWIAYTPITLTKVNFLLLVFGILAYYMARRRI